jgi:hypothetical protein
MLKHHHHKSTVKFGSAIDGGPHNFVFVRIFYPHICVVFFSSLRTALIPNTNAEPESARKSVCPNGEELGAATLERCCNSKFVLQNEE